ncbi:MAG: sigma-54-dependent Fis family transcriptional regulator [Clostridia bacterium]|nr:sigma-54-dependent Fis family transcriptional regulator [Clostridia bacterium]
MNNEIKEARELYTRKGILKREILRDEIALSWARSSFYNINMQKLPIQENNQLHELRLSNDDQEEFEFVDAILILDQVGRLIGCYKKSPLVPYEKISYEESNIGTNGIGLAFNLKKESYVSNYEHYHQLFFDKITYGIPKTEGTNFRTLGFVLSLDSKSFENKKTDLLALSQKIILQMDDQKSQNIERMPTSIDSYFEGKSDTMKYFKQRIGQSSMMENHIFIHGAKGTGKEIVARAIHKMSPRNGEKIHVLYCDKLPADVIIEDYFDHFKSRLEDCRVEGYGLVYCEAIESLSVKAQDVLTRLLECKPINTNRDKHCKNKGYRFIFSSELTLAEMESKGLMNKKLLNRINGFTINIPSLSDIKEDLPTLITQRIDKYVAQFYLDPIVFSNDLINVLTRYPWPENYRELDKIIEKIIYQGRHEKIIDQRYVPKSLQKNGGSTEQLLPLAVTEKKEIIKALELMDYNVALTARALGIGRSTLYRKLEKYHIEL